MKKIIYGFLIASIIVFTACDINDTVDENVIVGEMAPHAYWEVGSSTVSAGSNVPFIAQYYTTAKDDIDHLEVWYNIVEDEYRAVSCPWTTSFVFSVTASKTELKRVNQLISIYNHDEKNWNDSLRAYRLEASFPTSRTLASTVWSKPASFEPEKMNAFFGNAFMKQFKDSLFKLMKVTDFQKMYQGLNLVDNFKIYLDSTKNELTGGYDYHFPKDAQGNTPVPQTIVDIYKNIPFSDLILNKSTNVYDVEYTRSYKINAMFKALDKKGVAGLSLTSEISLN